MNNFIGYKYKSINTIEDTQQDLIEASIDGLKDVNTITEEDERKHDFDENIKTINNIDELALIIKMLLELSWGKDWGEISPEYSEDEENPIFPKIVYDINTRELSEYNSKKPILYETIKEKINDKYTGDGFNVYRQWYDTVVEFNFYHHSIKEARQLMLDFEKIINTYMGLIKSKGLSEMIYLEEIPSEMSIKYKPGIPMKSNSYYIRFESIHTVRTSLLKNIELIIKNNNYTNS